MQQSNPKRTASLRRVVVATAIIVPVAGIAAAAIYFSGVFPGFSSAGPAAAASTDNGYPTSTKTVVQRALSSQTQVSGTLTFSGDYSIVNQTHGTITALPAEGDVISPGHQLYAIDGSPVVLLEGSTPAYRTLSEGMSGPDVAELNADLVALGYGNADLAGTDTFTAETATAVAKLKAALGYQVPDAVTSAQAQVDSDQTALNNAQLALASAQKTWNGTIADKQTAADSAQSDYAAVFTKWLGIVPSADEIIRNPESLLASWNVHLDALFGIDTTGTNLPPDDPTTKWSEPVVAAWQLYPGTIIPTCDSSTTLPSTGTCIQREMDNAWTAYQDALDALEAAKNQATQATGTAQDNVNKAKANLTAAQKDLAGYETTSLMLGQAVFLPSDVRVTSVNGTLGAPGQAGMVLLKASSTTLHVTVPVSASQQSKVKVGDQVTITLPDLSTTQGVVSSVGSVAQSPNGGGSPTIDVEIALDQPLAAGGLDQAPVVVSITTATVNDALAVPVTALLATSSGGYAVEVVDRDGTHHLVGVSLGLFDDQDGLVQVTNTSLTKGQTVVVPAL